VISIAIIHLIPLSLSKSHTRNFVYVSQSEGDLTDDSGRSRLRLHRSWTLEGLQDNQQVLNHYPHRRN
jgi:hypothetical protein